jgi:hypothetical protein
VLRSRAGGAIRQRALKRGHIIRVDQLPQHPSHPGEGVPAEHRLSGRAQVLSDAVRIDHRDQVRAVLHQRPESLLALLEGSLGPLALADLSLPRVRQRRDAGGAAGGDGQVRR